MSRFRVVMFLAIGCGWLQPASAAWLHCIALGQDKSGPLADLTAIVDVGDAGPQQLHDFEKRLIGYVLQTDAEASGLRATCSASPDQVQAAVDYTKLWNNTTHQLGWTRVSLVAPSAWLPPSAIRNETGGY